MKYRTPKVNCPSEMDKANSDGLWREEYSVTTITPIYGGGVEAGVIDSEMPIRASAIRGQLRFWWRLLATQKGGESKAVYSAESDLWGAMSESSDDKSSPVVVRIIAGEFETQECRSVYNSKPSLKYAMFSAEDNTEVIKPGFCFKLSVRLFRKKVMGDDGTLIDEPDEMYLQKKNDVIEALRWWASFGGIGSRTRRGLGSVFVHGLDPVILDEVVSQGMTIRKKQATKNATEAWNSAITAMYNIRQAGMIGRNKGSDPGKKNKLGRSFWPEADSIRKLTGRNANGKHKPEHKALISFPRAAFGMPIIFEIRGEAEPEKTELTPLGYERMASPIILKAMAVGDGMYAPIALCLPTTHIGYINVSLKYTGGGRELKDGSNPLEWWPKSENEKNEKAEFIKPMKNNKSNDPLTAFLNYFDER